MGTASKSLSFDSISCALVLCYEFQDIKVEDYDIDSIVDSPPDSPKGGLARTRYSPNGLAAIEIKEPNVTREKVDTYHSHARCGLNFSPTTTT